ncbi:MAG: serine/threonine protein kinase [Labilithrix sp.]|nr:serine/threonine protein kinase [Labilithrix sp.]
MTPANDHASPKNSAGKPARLVPGLDVRAGQTIAAKYRVEGLLGSGSSGVSLAARNVHLQEPVVLKILASYTDAQADLVRRRLEKARQASRLRSSHLARILDIGVTEDGLPYVASEKLEGRTLEQELEERGTIPVEEAVRWTLEACEALAEAHAAGLVHGDLKPNNFFLADAKGDEPRRLVVLDFGTTSPLDAIGDQTASAFFGSPAFLAPEQIQDPGKSDGRVDVWALGVLLYRMISGGLPFSADSVSGMIVAVVYDEPALLRDAPYELAAVVASCLQKTAEKRPADVRELAASLEPFAGDAGKRLSERVAVMLDAPPASIPQGFAPDDSGAFRALSLTPVPPRPGAAKVRSFRPTWRTAAGAFAAAAAACLLTWTAVDNVQRPSTFANAAAAEEPASITTVSAADLPSEHQAAQVAAAEALAIAEAAAARQAAQDEAVAPAPDETQAAAGTGPAETEANALPDARPSVSFAPSEDRPARPTPLATAQPIPTVPVEALRTPPPPTSQAAPLPAPPHAVVAPPAPLRPSQATSTRHGIPTTREASAVRMTVDPRY